jgi:hypothetical protein
MSRREFYAVPDYQLRPEYQLLAPRRLLCLLCAKVISTNGRAKAAHEKGVEHRVALAEMAGRKAS